MKSLLAKYGTDSDAQKGTPDYMLVYGDMMGQLLCFFILLVSMSTVRAEKFQRMMDSIRQAFGYDLGAQVAPGDAPATSSLWDNLRLATTPRGHKNVQGGSETVNLAGREFLCRTVREGQMLSMGDRAEFEAGASQLTPAMRADLDALAGFVGEYPNRLIVRGHVAAQDGAEGGEWNLSFARARAVADYLEEKGINPKRLRIAACGSADPVASNLTDEGRARNRRTEIIVSEELIENVIPRRPDHE